MAEPPEPAEGWTAPELAAELPELRLLELTVDVPSGPKSTKALRRQLKELSGRWYGSKAIEDRGRPVPQAYRILFRQLGIDPDATPTPYEAALKERLLRGQFPSRGLVADAALLATVETGVGVFVADDERLDGPLGLRPAAAGEPLGDGPLAPELPPGRLVVADAAAAVAVVFAPPSAAHAVRPETTRVRAWALRAPGVPPVHVEEALWVCAEAVLSG